MLSPYGPWWHGCWAGAWYEQELVVADTEAITKSLEDLEDIEAAAELAPEDRETEPPAGTPEGSSSHSHPRQLYSFQALAELAAALEMPLPALEKGGGQAIAKAVQDKLKGVVRVHHPACRPLTDEERQTLMAPAGTPAFYVKLGAEFDLGTRQAQGWRFETAWNHAYLDGRKTPRVLSVYPERLYEGEPRKVSVSVGPKLAAAGVEVGAAEMGTDFNIGQVAPVMLGFHGEGERAPYWEIRSGPKAVVGVYNFWLAVVTPSLPAYLYAYIEADLRIKRWGGIPVGPPQKAWESRPRFEITAG